MNPLAMVAEAGTPALSADNITAATNNVFTVVSDTLSEIVTEPIFLMFFVSGLIFMSIRIIRGLKKV